MIVTNPFSVRSWTRAQIENVSRGWWVLLLTGVISVVIGGLVLSIDWTVSDLAVFLGALLLFRGIFMMFSVPVDGAGAAGRLRWAWSRHWSGSRCGSGPARRCW